MAGNNNNNYGNDDAANPDQSTPQEHLQSLSLKHWKKPIEAALDLHLHGRHTFRGGDGSRVLIANGYRNWDDDYCKYLAKLVPMMNAAKANGKLSARFAKSGWMGGPKAWMVQETIECELRENVRRGNGDGGVRRGGVGAGMAGRGHGLGGDGRAGVGRGHGVTGRGGGRGGGQGGHAGGRGDRGDTARGRGGRGGHGRGAAPRGGDARGRGNSTYFDRDQPRF